ncbi:hypothetical protein PYCCODRAFT_1105661 [Trametes coccinea BRFM310]|uniref:Uncharacterized protein n=1 Tax=Trametes coccinea (strain BRFM310) TaxID=1353009 RepID=A0A1Y2I9I7_TRAC3|nr:hypothetical protein PYCCODRAFT_1105661 [Trametes coccinea BRFM310]
MRSRRHAAALPAAMQQRAFPRRVLPAASCSPYTSCGHRPMTVQYVTKKAGAAAAAPITSLHGYCSSLRTWYAARARLMGVLPSAGYLA